MNLVLISAIAAIGLYLFTAARLGMNMSHGDSNVARSDNTLLAIGLLAVSLHAVFLYQGIIDIGGLNLSFFNTAGGKMPKYLFPAIF